MKRICAILTAAVLCVLLCACGSSRRLPYLEESERAEIEQSILGSVRLIVSSEEYSSNSLTIKLSNPTQYDLSDFRIRLSALNYNCNISFLPKGGNVSVLAYFSPNYTIEAGRKTQAELYYTIDAYTYKSEPVELTMGMGEQDLELVIRTDAGERILTPGVNLDLDAETIESLKNYKVSSLTVEAGPNQDGTYRITIKGTASPLGNPSGSLGCKLTDATGLILSSGNCYVSETSKDISVYVWYPLSPGRYNLSFYEFE